MTDATDPRGLMADAFQMPDIGEAECRSIFLDWALGLPEGSDPQAAAAKLLARHDAPAHPMSAVLRAAAADPAPPRRRGGRRRVSGTGRPPRPRAR